MVGDEGCPRAADAARFRFGPTALACCAGKRFAFPQLRTLAGSNPMHRAQTKTVPLRGPFPILWWAMRDVRVRLAPPASRFVAPLLACCAGKRLRVSSAPHPVGFESRRMGSKKPATELVAGFSDSVVPPAGFEPAISTLKGWRPWPLDDGDSGKEYSRLFCRRVYRWQTGKPPHRSWLSIPIFKYLNL